MTTVNRGYRIQIYPNEEQRSKLNRTFGCVRWLYNQLLNMQNLRYETEPDARFLGTYNLNYILTQVKKEYPWLCEADSTALQNVSDRITSAFRNYFDKNARHPRFHAKKHEQKYTSKCVNNNIWVIDEHHIRLPKIGTVYYRGRMPEGTVKSATVTLKATGKIIVSLSCETEVFEKAKTHKTTGVDAGLIDLAVLSEGKKFPIYRYDKELEGKLVYWQRKAAQRLLKAKEVMKNNPEKKLTDFRNYQKARTLVAKYHEQISNRRLNHLHEVTAWLVENYDVICIEDLKTKGMLKNHRLAKAISNASWAEFARELAYKCEWYGKTLITVDPHYTSQTCHVCGTINSRLGLSPQKWLKIREWQCPECSTVHDRDINAARVILNLGLIQAA